MPSPRLAAVAQLEIDTETAQEKEAEAGRQVALWTQLMTAIRRAVLVHGGPSDVADNLDKIWGVDGLKRPVSGTTFAAALSGAERNYFRIEWVIWFATHSPEVAELLRVIADGKSALEPKDELANLYEVLEEEFPKQAAALKRKAITKRRARR